MGFRISSLGTVTSIATNLQDVATTAKSNAETVLASLDSLSSIVSGGNVGTSLSKLKSGVSQSTKQAFSVLNNVSAFITDQVSRYSMNEDQAKSNLQNVSSALEGLEV